MLLGENCKMNSIINIVFRSYNSSSFSDHVIAFGYELI